MSNKNTAKKIPFSVIDFSIIVVIIALVFGVAARYDVVDRLFSKTPVLHNVIE